MLLIFQNTQCGSVRQECTVCRKVLWSKRALSIHYRMKHFNSTRVGFVCRICKQRFDSKSERYPLCNTSFILSCGVLVSLSDNEWCSFFLRAQHYTEDHQGDSPFNCPICHKGFASKSGMYGHKQTHEKMSLSKCEFCGKEFSVSHTTIMMSLIIMCVLIFYPFIFSREEIATMNIC